MYSRGRPACYFRGQGRKFITLKEGLELELNIIFVVILEAVAVDRLNGQDEVYILLRSIL
ncbi:hypothetical protein EMIT0324P_120013 [Pseudomonas chlororaphis]